MIIKNKINYNRIYISLNQGISIEVKGFDEISIKNNELKKEFNENFIKAKSLLDLYASVGNLCNSLIFNDIQKKGKYPRKGLPFPQKVPIILAL